MDDTLHNRASDANATRKRRSSILKSQRPARTPFSELEFNVATPTDSAKSRRVSFSRRTGVAEFVTNEATTTWKNVYEEHNKSLESSKDDSDVKSQDPPVAHLGKRIFDNQFEEVEAIDYIETITPSISNSLQNVNVIQQIASLESPNDQVSSPQCNYELTALTEQQSKLFGNEFTVTGLGEMSGRIEVNFSAIEHIDEGDDLANIEKDFGLASNVICHGPSDRHDMSEYIEVDLNMTNVVKSDVCDMSITDTIKSPKVQNVSQNRIVDKKGNDVDWVSDKENIVINPYVAPKETVNFAINEDNDKVLVFDGKRLTLETDKSDIEYREALLPNSTELTPQRKTIILNTVDDLPNFISSNSDISQYDEPIKPVDKIEIISKNTTKNCNNANLSLAEPNSVLCSASDKRQTTMLYEADEANISMTQVLPAKIITETIKFTDRRRTIIYEQDAVNISMTQALPSNILQRDDTQNDKALPKFYYNNKCNTSVTGQKDEPKTLVFDNEGNLSLTQALPNAILLNQEIADTSRSKTTYDDVNFDLSITEAVPAGIVIDQIQETVDQRQTSVCKNDDEDISFTKVLPSNIISVSSKSGKESMTEILPDNVIFKHRDLTKTVVFEDDEGNISITTGIYGRFSHFDESKNQNVKCKTITFEDNLDLSEAISLSSTLTPSQIVPVKASALSDVSERNSNDDVMHVQDRIDSSKTQNVKSGVKQSNIDKKENKLRVKGNNLDKKESPVKECNIGKTDKKESMRGNESYIDKKESMRVKEKNIDQKGKKSQRVKDNNIDKNYKKGSLLTDENETLEIPITENVNLVETIANNIRNSSLLNFIVEDLNTRERNKEFSTSENKNSILLEPRQNNAQQLSVIVYQNLSKNYSADKRPTRNDQSITEHRKDTPFDILKMKEDVSNFLGHEFSENVINPCIPYDEMSIKEDLEDNLGDKQSIKGHSLNNQFVILEMKEEIHGSQGNELSLKENIIDSPGDQLSIKENIIDSPGDILSVKEDIIDDSPKDQLSVKEDIVDSPGDQLSVKEDIVDSSGDQLSSKQINSASLYDGLSIKEDIEDNSSGKQNKEVDINGSFIDEMSIKEYSKDNPCDEIIIKELINDSPCDKRSIELVSTDNPSGYIIDTAYDEPTEAVASDQTIFRCMDNISKSGSTLCVSRCVKNSVPNSSSDLKSASSSKIRTLEYVLDVLLAVTSSTLENTELDKDTETDNDVQDIDIIGVPSHDTSYFIIDEGTDTQTDKVNSEEVIRIEDGRDNINNIITNQFASELTQCDQEIQTDKHGVPFIETIEAVGRNIESPAEKVESNLHKTLKTANNTQELLDMISNFTDIARSESQIENGVQCSPVVFSGTVPIADQTEVLSRKRLSFAPTRQSIIFNRDDLLSNISMAQAALQKSHSELEDSINVNLSPNDSDIKKNSCIDIEVVKTLNFDDESFSYASLKSDNTRSTPLKKINVLADDLQTDTNKSNVIPSYLKDVSDNIKHLMADLVKPMADSLPFDNAGDNSRFSKRIVSTTSIQLQTDLIGSSQIDLHKNGSLIEETNHDYLCKLRNSERGNDLPPCMVEKGGDPVIIFDQHNPLNNILLRPLDSVQAHRYSPPKPVKDLVNKSEDTLCKTQSVKSPNENKVTTKPTVGSLSSCQHDDIDNDNLGGTQTLLCTSLSTKSPDRDKSIKNQIKQVKHTETNTDIAMKAKNLNATKTHVKESEVNTNIVMKSNVDLLKVSSSLTIVVTEEEKPHSTLSNDELNEGPKLQWKEDTVIDQNSVSTCSGKKRHYSPGTPRKSSIKKAMDNPSPCMKMQKLSNSLIDSRDSNLKPEKDVNATNVQRLDGENIIGNSKKGSGITVQQFRAEYNMESPKKLVLNKTIDSVSQPNSIRSEVSESSTGLIPSSILPSSSYVMQLENVSSFTSSKNLHTMSYPSHTTSTAPKSHSQSITVCKPDWQSGLQSLVDVNDCDSGVNIVAKIDMLPFMGSFECEWESSAVDTWCFRLLHGRIRLTIRLAHRHSNLTRTLVRADTPVSDMVVETVQHEKKNSVAILCVRFASETMRFIVSRAGSKPCFASDVPQLLRRCAAVARVAVRWGRAMHDAKLHLAYTLDNEGHLALKVANIPLRSVWEVNMDVELVVGGAGEVPWPRASGVRVIRVVSDVPVADRDVKRAMQATPRDWGHVPRTLWRMFRYLKQKTRDDDIILLPTNDVKLHRGMLKEHCQA